MCKTCVRHDPAVAEANFRAKVAAQGGTVIGEYLNGQTKVHVRCSAGHDCYPRPANVGQAHGICKPCGYAGRVNPLVGPAEAAFKAKLAELGATLLEPSWLGALTPHHVRCAAGHDCYPRPATVQQGQGICKPCGYAARVDPRPATAEAAFRATLAELNATLLETDWLGSIEPHRVRCAAGHECSPRPANVGQGQGICRACAGLDPATAEAEFRARIKELGATLLDTTWKGNKARYHVRCAEGHDCYPLPNSLQQRGSLCNTCAGKDPAVIFRTFKLAVLAQGGAVLEPEYLGSHNPHHLRCVKGHDCFPTPHSIQYGNGICRICAGVDPATSEAEFRRRVEDLGGEVLGVYTNSNTPCHVRCAQGHECFARPGGVGQGQGICAACAGKIWDAFYVVTGQCSLKFGITSGDARPRLRSHRRDGYVTVERLFTELPDGVARTLETTLIKDLAANGYTPVLRREYFPVEALDLVLSIVDEALGDWAGAQTVSIA